MNPQDKNPSDAVSREAVLKLRKLELEVAEAELTTEKARVELENAKREAEKARAKAEESLIYTFYDQVDEESIKAALAELGKWTRRFPGKEIKIILNSPGGSVIAGLALYDYILSLRSSGHKVTVVALGMAASMGGVLLQAGDRRVIGKNAMLLIHEVSAGAAGKQSEMEDQVRFTSRLWDKLAVILAERSKLSARQIKTRAKRVDWWLSASEAVKLGFADEIL